MSVSGITAMRVLPSIFTSPNSSLRIALLWNKISVKRISWSGSLLQKMWSALKFLSFSLPQCEFSGVVTEDNWYVAARSSKNEPKVHDFSSRRRNRHLQGNSKVPPFSRPMSHFIWNSGLPSIPAKWKTTFCISSSFSIFYGKLFSLCCFENTDWIYSSARATTRGHQFIALQMPG